MDKDEWYHSDAGDEWHLVNFMICALLNNRSQCYIYAPHSRPICGFKFHLATAIPLNRASRALMTMFMSPCSRRSQSFLTG